MKAYATYFIRFSFKMMNEKIPQNEIKNNFIVSTFKKIYYLVTLFIFEHKIYKIYLCFIRFRSLLLCSHSLILITIKSKIASII